MILSDSCSAAVATLFIIIFFIFFSLFQSFPACISEGQRTETWKQLETSDPSDVLDYWPHHTIGTLKNSQILTNPTR